MANDTPAPPTPAAVVLSPESRYHLPAAPPLEFLVAASDQMAIRIMADYSLPDDVRTVTNWMRLAVDVVLSAHQNGDLR